MTSGEARARLEPLLDWKVFVPTAVDLIDGERVFIDKPEQAKLSREALVIARRVPARLIGLPYPDIASITPATELPAEPGGIAYAEFDALMSQLLMREPFQPFSIEIRTGVVIEVTSRRRIDRTGRFVIVYDETRTSRMLYTYDQIARVISEA